MRRLFFRHIHTAFWTLKLYQVDDCLTGMIGATAVLSPEETRSFDRAARHAAVAYGLNCLMPRGLSLEIPSP